VLKELREKTLYKNGRRKGDERVGERLVVGLGGTQV